MRLKVEGCQGPPVIRLPDATADQLGLREGQDIDICVVDGALIVRRSLPRYTLAQLVSEAAGLTPPSLIPDEGEWR